jgi:phosphate-selective porin OprO/OprP
MKKHWTATIALIVACLFVGMTILVAQDSRVPGGDQKIPLGAEVRNGKLVFESKDGDYRWWFDSRIQFDGAFYFENKNEMSNGFTFRRLTFALKSKIAKDWEAELDLDFAEQVSTKSQIDLRDAWMKYTVPDMNLSFQAGNFKEPFGMERLNSSRLLTFLERSSPSNAFALGRRVGISARYWTDYAQVTAALMGHETGTRIDKGQRDEGYSTNLRISGAPINEHGHNLHLGVAGSYKIPDATSDLAPNTIEISSRTETYVSNPKLLHTGDIADVNYYNRYGGELMYINGPFYMQSEYMGSKIYRWYQKPTVSLQGGYVTLSYTITGETRYYYVDEGEVGPIEAAQNPWGAIELAARYSITDLNDFAAGIKGGQSNQLMLGVNYYPNLNFKFQLNYSIVNLDDFANRKGNLIGNDDFSFIQFRFQASM